MIDINTLPKDATAPVVCRNADDFLKFLAFSVTLMSDGMPPDALSSGLRYLLHEYLALVLRGDLRPYQAAPDSDTVKLFREAMVNFTEFLLNNGSVPMKEVNGTFEFDLDTIYNARGGDPSCSIRRK